MSPDGDAMSVAIPDLPGFSFRTNSSDPDAAITEARAVLTTFASDWIAEYGRLPQARTLVQLLESEDAPTYGQVVVGLRAQPVGGEPVRVNISLDSLTLGEIDRAAGARGMTRSAYLALAARELEGGFGTTITPGNTPSRLLGKLTQHFPAIATGGAGATPFAPPKASSVAAPEPDALAEPAALGLDDEKHIDPPNQAASILYRKGTRAVEGTDAKPPSDAWKLALNRKRSDK